MSVAAVATVLGPALAQARFLQTDPVGYKDDVDLYSYVHNDPTDMADPAGLESPCITMGGDCGDPVMNGAVGMAPLEPAVTFFTGIGPKQQAYGDNSLMARAAQQSVAADIARSRVYRALDEGRTPRNPMGVYFGPKQYAIAAAGRDTFSHVMGSVVVTANMVGNDKVQFSISNAMTMSSLAGASLADKLGAHQLARTLEQLNHDKGPGATVQIRVTWTEKLTQHVCTGSLVGQYSACN